MYLLQKQTKEQNKSITKDPCCILSLLKTYSIFVLPTENDHSITHSEDKSKL